MRAVVQRVKNCRLTINEKEHATINNGLLVFLGITDDDTEKELQWLSRKIVHLRIFSDESGHLNYSVQEVDGDIMLVSQFTLIGNIRKGHRPSFAHAAKPNKAVPLYEAMIKQLSADAQRKIATGVFGADMQIELVNDGPVTIIMDTHKP